MFNGLAIARPAFLSPLHQPQIAGPPGPSQRNPSACPAASSSPPPSLVPIQKAEGRDVAVGRMVRLMETAHRRGAEVVVFPELALTTFFPRWYEEDLANADHWYETALPSNATAPLFEAARKFNIGFHLGYAEKTPDGHRFNTAVYVHPSGEVGAEVPQGAPARACGVRPAAQGPAPGEALFRGRRPRLPGGARAGGRGGGQYRHADLQRPPLAGGLAGAGVAAGRAGHARLQHAVAEHGELRLRGAPPAGVPQPPEHPGRLLPECLLRRRRRQGRRRGRASSCSAIPSSSTPRARSWPRPPAGATS